MFWYLPSIQNGKRKQAAAQPASSSDQSKPSTPPPKPAPMTDVPADQVQRAVKSQIEEVQKLPDERKLTELEKNLRRLDALASDEAVADVTDKIAGTLGLDQEQYAPKETPARARSIPKRDSFMMFRDRVTVLESGNTNRSLSMRRGAK